MLKPARAVPLAALLLLVGCHDALEPSTAAPVSGDPASRLTFFQDTDLGDANRDWNFWMTARSPVNQSTDEGDYTASIYSEDGFTKARVFSIQKGWWAGNTLRRLTTQSMSWSGGCNPGGSAPAPTSAWVLTDANNCLATTITYHYRIDNHFIETAMSGDVSGATTVPPGVTRTYSVNRSGNPWGGWYNQVNFLQSTDGGSTWSYPCMGPSTSCDVSTGTQSYLIRAQFWGHYTNRNADGSGVPQNGTGFSWTTSMVRYDTPAISVTVLPPTTPLSVSVSGPWNIDPWTNTTWTGGVSGGYPPYTYQWLINSQVAQEGGTSFSSSSFSPYTQPYISLRVTDSQGSQQEAGINVYVGYYCETPPYCDAMKRGKKPPAPFR